MPSFFTRFALTAMILLASVLLHLGLLGVILWAERHGATASETQAMEVELVQPPELPKVEPPKPAPTPEQPKPEPPKIEAAKPEPPKPAEQKPQPEPSAQPSKPPEQPPVQTAKAPPPDQPPTPPEKSVQQEGPSGGPPSESKSKLTPEEIAAFRAQVQRCWTLPVGVPNAMKLEAVLRVSLARNGALAAGPDLLKANASAGGPVLVGIAMKALRECAPYRLPAAKYNDWKVLDLRFLATGMTGLGSARPPAASQAR